MNNVTCSCILYYVPCIDSRSVLFYGDYNGVDTDTKLQRDNGNKLAVKLADVLIFTLYNYKFIRKHRTCHPSCHASKQNECQTRQTKNLLQGVILVWRQLQYSVERKKTKAMISRKVVKENVLMISLPWTSDIGSSKDLNCLCKIS